MHRLTTEFALTHQQIADLLCKSRAAVSNYLRLLNLNRTSDVYWKTVIWIWGMLDAY